MDGRRDGERGESKEKGKEGTASKIHKGVRRRRTTYTEISNNDESRRTHIGIRGTVDCYATKFFYIEK